MSVALAKEISTTKASRPKTSGMRRKEAIAGFYFISPWLLGLLIFTAGPVIASLYLGFTEYDLFNPPKWVGFDNYYRLFFKTEVFWIAVRVTALYSVITVNIFANQEKLRVD